MLSPDAPKCLQANAECSGDVEYRMPLSGTGVPYPRCDHHWSQRLDEQDRIARTYHRTSHDPTACGERWDED